MTGEWLPPPAAVTIHPHEVHVWRARLDRPQAELTRWWAVLHADERQRAERFRFERDRHRFIVGRGLLRTLLSRYLRLRPEQIELAYNAYGKPEIVQTGNQTALSFNLSHSQDLALFAIAQDRHVGVDLEYVRADLADEQIAVRFFAPAEVEALRALPASQRVPAFFRCWTRKEAFIKARGEGLSLPLDQFQVSLEPDAAVLLHTADPTEAQRWRLEPLEPAPGYTAAIAVEGHTWQLRCWALP